MNRDKIPHSSLLLLKISKSQIPKSYIFQRTKRRELKSKETRNNTFQWKDTYYSTVDAKSKTTSSQCYCETCLRTSTQFFSTKLSTYRKTYLYLEWGMYILLWVLFPTQFHKIIKSIPPMASNRLDDKKRSKGLKSTQTK